MFVFFSFLLFSSILFYSTKLQTALLEGEFPILDLLGIVFGHIYHHCKTTNILITPKALIKWYRGDSKYSKMIREKYKEISSDFAMQ